MRWSNGPVTSASVCSRAIGAKTYPWRASPSWTANRVPKRSSRKSGRSCSSIGFVRLERNLVRAHVLRFCCLRFASPFTSIVHLGRRSAQKLDIIRHDFGDFALFTFPVLVGAGRQAAFHVHRLALLDILRR